MRVAAHDAALDAASTLARTNFRGACRAGLRHGTSVGRRHQAHRDAAWVEGVAESFRLDALNAGVEVKRVGLTPDARYAMHHVLLDIARDLRDRAPQPAAAVRGERSSVSAASVPGGSDAASPPRLVEPGSQLTLPDGTQVPGGSLPSPTHPAPPNDLAGGVGLKCDEPDEAGRGPEQAEIGDSRDERTFVACQGKGAQR